MDINKKIVAVFSGMLLAGFIVSGSAAKTAQAQTSAPQDPSPTVEQLQQTINLLLEQIKQMAALIARLKPLETCGNGICRLGETAATCPADCGKTVIIGQNKIKSLPENFSATEVVSNNLPESAEFWTQAYCPGGESAFEYKIPAGYRVESCQYGKIGSHGGCSYCTMSKIKLVNGEDAVLSADGICGAATNFNYGDNEAPRENLCAQGISGGIGCYLDGKGGCKWCWSCGTGKGKLTCCEAVGNANIYSGNATMRISAPQSGNVYSSPTTKIPFSWSWSGVADPAAVTMDLVDQNGKTIYGKIAGASDFSYSAAGGSGLIPAPVNLVIPVGRYQYRVRICTSLAKTNCVSGDYFTIVKTTDSTVNPNITINIMSPKSGEVLQPGTQYTIRWTNSGLPANATQSINIMNGTRGTIDDPNALVVSGLPATANEYVWTVAGNNGWGVGIRENILKNFAGLLGAGTAQASGNQYVIRIDAAVPGTWGSIGWGVSEPFSINQ